MLIRPVIVALGLATIPLIAVAAEPAKPAGAAKPSAKEEAGPKSLGGAKGWEAYSAGEKASLVCYVVGHPSKSAPANATRGRVDVQVTHRPAEKALNVVDFELGYTAKPNSNAELTIDGKKFTLFTNKEAAWNSDAATDRLVTNTMAKGKQAVITATSERGTTTTDTYALEGFGQALALADKACNLKR